jgi:hypothetical protein
MPAKLKLDVAMLSRHLWIGLLTVVALVSLGAIVTGQGHQYGSYLPYIGNDDIGNNNIGNNDTGNDDTGNDVSPEPPQTTRRDVSAEVERLGNPFLAQYPGDSHIYPRNVWDMQLFGNKVYMGSGNSSNDGPNRNAGPVAVWTYDLTMGKFTKEYVVDEEQIDVFQIVHGTLLIPGHDPRTEIIGLYRMVDGVWEPNDRIEGIQHVYGIEALDTELFAAIGGNGIAAVAVSTDSGESWHNVPVGALRVYSLFVIDERLYAAKGIYTDAGYDALPPKYKPDLIGIYEYQGGQSFVARPDLKFSVLFPDYNGNLDPSNPWYTIGKITRQVSFRDKLVYIGGSQFNDHQTLPFGLFAAGPVERAQRIALPNGALPWDTLVRGDTLYVLLGAKQVDGRYVVSVISTKDLVNWTELFRFASDTFARSFELTPAGDFLFGLGTGIPTTPDRNDWITWEMSPSAGDILRLSRAAAQGTH